MIAALVLLLMAVGTAAAAPLSGGVDGVSRYSTGVVPSVVGWDVAPARGRPSRGFRGVDHRGLRGLRAALRAGAEPGRRGFGAAGFAGHLEDQPAAGARAALPVIRVA